MLANASTNTITGLSFEWIDGNFTSLQVSWDPVTPPQGGGVTYHVSYTPVLANGTITEVVTSEVEESRILLSGLDPSLFYSVTVEAIIQDASSASANIGK